MRKLHYYCLAIALIASLSVASAAEFTMNFQPASGGSTEGAFPSIVDCNRGNTNSSACVTDWTVLYLADEPTPFFLEKVVIDGLDYIHMIVGDPATGFAQESYVRGRSENILGVSNMATPYMVAYNNPGMGPGVGPLSGEGNGMGNPDQVAIRQVLGGEWDEASGTWSCGVAEFCSDFEKSNSAMKPRILQVVTDGGVTSDFELDMRGLGYSGEFIDGVLVNQGDAFVVNKLLFDNPDIPGNFDMATDTQAGRSVVTAGRYIYEGGGRDVDNSSRTVTQIDYEYRAGTYTYEDGSYDMENEDWTSYYGIDNPDYNL